MLICTLCRRDLKLGKVFYTVLDTDDNVSETVEKSTVVEALKSVSIFGLRKTGVVDKSVMQEKTDYQYVNNKDVHIPCYSLEVETWTTRDVPVRTVSCAGCRPSKSNIMIYYGDSWIGTFEMDTKYRGSYVSLNCVVVYEYNGRYLIDASTSYVDKHYYREDDGKAFYKHYLVYNKQVICRTDFIDEDSGRLNTSLNPMVRELATPHITFYDNKEFNLDSEEYL